MTRAIAILIVLLLLLMPVFTVIGVHTQLLVAGNGLPSDARSLLWPVNRIANQGFSWGAAAGAASAGLCAQWVFEHIIVKRLGWVDTQVLERLFFRKPK